MHLSARYFAISWTALFLQLQLLTKIGEAYVIPEPSFELLKPKGVRVSIPDATGIQFLGFHGNVNKGISSNELGEITGDVYRAQNGRWTVQDTSVSLKEGDVINYWIYVQANGVSFRKDSQRWAVTARTTEASTVPPPSPGNLLFQDNFDSMSTSTWKREVKMPLEPDYEFCVYHNENHQFLVTVNEGILKIRPLILEDYYGENATAYGLIRLNPCTSNVAAECTKQAIAYNIIPPVISARLTTKESFSFQHGRVEIRAKFPEGDWLYPEMWLEPKYYSHVPDYPNGRVLLGLSRGNENLINVTTRNIYDSRKLEFGVRTGTTVNVKQYMVSKTRANGPRWTQQFHVYTTVWNADGFRFFVDEEEVGRLSPGPTGWLQDSKQPTAAPFDQEYVLCIGVGVGGIRVFPDGTVSAGYMKPWRNVGAKAMLKFWQARNEWLPSWRRQDGRKTALEIDYVRVYSV